MGHFNLERQGGLPPLLLGTPRQGHLGTSRWENVSMGRAVDFGHVTSLSWSLFPYLGSENVGLVSTFQDCAVSGATSEVPRLPGFECGGPSDSRLVSRGMSLTCPLPTHSPLFQYNADKAIVDSGTTLLRLPQKVFNAVVEAVARTSLVSPQGADKSRRTPAHDPVLESTPVYVIVFI